MPTTTDDGTAIKDLEKVPTKTKAGGAVKKAHATSARARRGRRGRVANTLDPSA